METRKKWIVIVVGILILTAGISGIDLFSHIFSVFTMFSSPSGNTLLTKVTPDGTTDWQLILPGLVSPARILTASDGGYILYGGDNFPDNVLPSLLVTKIRQDGNISWKLVKSPTAYGSEIPILGAAEFVLPQDNGYTVIDDHGVVIRLDDRGTEQWHRYYYNNLRDAIATSDGGYALAGSYFYRDPPTDYSSTMIGWVIHLDASGNRIWEYQAHEYLECNSLVELANGTLQATCKRPQSKDLVRLDRTGNVTGRDALPADTGLVSSFENGLYVSFNATTLSDGSIHITLEHPNATVKEINLRNSVSQAAIKQIYTIIRTGDKGFLVFSAVPM